MQKPSFLAKWGMAVLLVSSLSSCEDILEQYFPNKTKTPNFPSLGQDIPFYALSGGTRLDAYNTGNAASRTGSVAITGLASGETLLAIDFRPATGQLYGVSSTSRLYVINQNTGVARAIGAGAFTPAVSGNLVSFDFNPTVDRIRLVTSTGQNLRLHPETGTVAVTDGAINGAEGASLTGVAYTNNTNGVTSTALYAINTQNQQLYLVNPPNEGTLVPVGNLNLPVSGNGGFDIDAKTGTALGLYTVKGQPTLFAVDLSNGGTRPLAEYAANLNYSGLAIPTRPVAYAVGNLDGQGGRTTLNSLHIFDPTDTSDPEAQVTKLFQLARNEAVLGMDFRPATGQLYALVLGHDGPFPPGSNLSASTRLYTINPATAEATRVADISIPLDFGAGNLGLKHAFDFNPVTDEIRIVSPTGQNLRVNPTTGAATAESPINPASTTDRAIAYTNSLVPATSTSLYALGSETSTTTRKLYLLNMPNSGTLSEVGTLDVSGLPIAFPTATTQMVTFDIAGTTNTAYGIAGSGVRYGIARINLSTGSTTLTRQLSVSSARSITALAVGLGF